MSPAQCVEDGLLVVGLVGGTPDIDRADFFRSSIILDGLAASDSASLLQGSGEIFATRVRRSDVWIRVLYGKVLVDPSLPVSPGLHDAIINHCCEFNAGLGKLFGAESAPPPGPDLSSGAPVFVHGSDSRRPEWDVLHDKVYLWSVTVPSMVDGEWVATTIPSFECGLAIPCTCPPRQPVPPCLVGHSWDSGPVRYDRLELWSRQYPWPDQRERALFFW